jgi:hypothetical protein
MSVKKLAMRGSAEILKLLQKKMFDHYDAYRKGKITQREYLSLIRPIDRQIERIELDILGYLSMGNRPIAAPELCSEDHSSGHS